MFLLQIHILLPYDFEGGIDTPKIKPSNLSCVYLSLQVLTTQQLETFLFLLQIQILLFIYFCIFKCTTILCKIYLSVAHFFAKLILSVARIFTISILSVAIFFVKMSHSEHTTPCKMLQLVLLQQQHCVYILFIFVS